MNASLVNTTEANLLQPTGVPSYGTNINNVFIVLCAINGISSVIATITNALAMAAIWKTPSLHEPSSVMIFFLALTDLSVGLLVQPCHVGYLVSILVKDHHAYDIMFLIKKRLSSLLSLISMMTVAAISTERYLALVLHLRYAAVVTTRRCVVACLLMWVVPTTLTIVSLWQNERTWFRVTVSFFGFLFGVSSLITIPTLQGRIFTILRRHQQQIQDQTNIASRLHGLPQINILKYRKSVLAILYVVMVAFLNYVPFGICYAIIYYSGETPQNRVALESTLTILFLNSSLNPFIYCWRIREIRRFIISTFRHLCRLNETVNNAPRERHTQKATCIRLNALTSSTVLQTEGTSPSTVQPVA